MSNNLFEIIPAIDILDGKCVRLTQGQYNKVEEFSANPEDIAKKWLDEGATRLHIVDLNGAREGFPVNKEVIYKIISSIRKKNIKIQVGGGIRNSASIKEYLDQGINYTILGTKAFQDSSFVKEMVDLYKDQIILGLDIKNGRIALSGWEETTDLSFKKLSEETHAVKQIIYTDVSKDGTLAGPNLKSIREISSALKSEIIVSGGISSINDILNIVNLKKENHSNITGVILGKSLYKGTIDLSEAINSVKTI